MKITWLGQAGLLFETDNIKIMVDPYFSDICASLSPQSKRRVPADEKFTKIQPDILVLTHNHLDHTDPQTLPYFVHENTPIHVILSADAHDSVKKAGTRSNDYIVFEPDTRWTEKDVTITGVKAYHSEPTAFGVIIEHKGKKYYVTGDTLCNDNILKSLPSDIYAVFVPINGWGNNMNVCDAAYFAKKCGAKYSVPVHWGMFDDIDPQIFKADNRIIPEIYKEIVFD